jgi:hypothetical protein
MTTWIKAAIPVALIASALRGEAEAASAHEATQTAIRMICGDSRVKEALGVPVTVVNSRSDLVLRARTDGTFENEFGFGVRGPKGMGEAHLTLASRSGGDRYRVKELVVLCRDQRIEIKSSANVAAMPDTLALVFAVALTIAWPVSIVFGIKAARRKGVSAHWMWFGLHPIGGILAWAIIALGVKRIPCSHCGKPIHRGCVCCPFCGTPRTPGPTRQHKITVACPQCGANLRGVTADMIGDIGVCAKCKQEFLIAEKQ